MNASGNAVSRISGLMMLCLALGYSGKSEGGRRRALAPLLALSLLAAGFLIYTGVTGATVGLLLWPAAATHFILAILLGRAWMESQWATG